MARMTPRPMGRVHSIGAGPVGLFLAALLQSVDGQRVRLYERRDRVHADAHGVPRGYLVADSIESYKEDEVDGQDVEAIFEPFELETRLAYRRLVAPDVRALLDEWTRGFVPLNTVEQTLSDSIDRRGNRDVERVAGALTADDAVALVAGRDPRRLHGRALTAARPAGSRGRPQRA